MLQHTSQNERISELMQNKIIPFLLVLVILFVMMIVPLHAAGASMIRTVSPNIPLDSYIYTYLTKLDGLGYLKAMLPDTKPYTRVQAAQWVQQMLEYTATLQVPDYGRAMLNRLQWEFDRELMSLNKENAASGIYRMEATGQAVYYDGRTLTQHPDPIKSTYQPLNANNNGYRLAEGLNNILTLRGEGTVNDYFSFSATPRFSYDHMADCSISLTSGYVKTRIGNLGLQLGKDALWWGPGEWGNLTLTNNAAAQTAFKLANLEPIRLGGLFKFLKEANGAFFYSELQDERPYVKDPALMGIRATFNPTVNFTCGASRNSIVGGEGHQLSSEDYLEFLTGKNAESSATEKWDSNAGFDFHWRIPRWGGIQVYGEYYGEDQAGKILPLPSRNAYLYGVYLPQLTKDGQWDLKLEKAFTTNWWYLHWVYREGYTYKDNIIGDAMGYNATRYDLKLTRYLTDGSWLVFNAEHLTMDQDAHYPQQVTSLRITYRMNLKSDLTLDATVGVAQVANLDYQDNRSASNYLARVGLSKRF
jgi:hypothetical protein